jgi:hypothetical protein
VFLLYTRFIFIKVLRKYFLNKVFLQCVESDLFIFHSPNNSATHLSISLALFPFKKENIIGLFIVSLAKTD